MQGASPLASPRLNPGGTGFSFGKQCPKGGLVPGVVGWLCCTGAQGGVCLSPRLPTMPFVCRFSPIPPPPFPSGEGGDLRLFHARGSAPCIPGAKSLTALTDSAVSVPGASLPWNRARACVHENNREKFLGVWGLLSRSPQRFPVLQFFQCRTGTSRIQNPQQKRLSRFCKTQNPSRHPIQQGNRRSGHQRKSSAK